MDNYKKQYEAMKKMVSLYQDEVVPGLWERIKELEQQLEKQQDPVTVIRCAKCKWWNSEFGVCEFWHGSRHPEHYCGEGVMKANDE